jgi:hypothetical protein
MSQCAKCDCSAKYSVEGKNYCKECCKPRYRDGDHLLRDTVIGGLGGGLLGGVRGALLGGLAGAVVAETIDK